MSDTEETMDTANESENITPTKRAAVIKRQKEKLEEKKDVDELEEELGGVDDLPEENDEEDSDQEYTTNKKKKPIKKPETVLDPAFQSRLVKKNNKTKSLKFILLLFRMKIKLNDLIIYLNKLKSSHISFKMVNLLNIPKVVVQHHH